jgi:hypothetical protein
MFKKLSNSWSLVQASWRVLMADKELMVFPIVSFLAALVVMITFAVPTILAGVLDSRLVNGELSVFSYVVGFLFYAVMYFVTIFSNTALVGAALIRLEGGDPTVRDGFRIAFDRLGTIFGYALIAATVGVILQAISERSGWLGRIVVSLVGFVWSIATFLVIPVLVVEKVGPVDAVKRSADLLKDTWGEQIAGNLSVGLVFGLVSVLALVVGIPLILVAVTSGSVALIIIAVALLVLVLMGISLISSTLRGIYTAAVYRYATVGDTGGYFEADMVKAAFKAK